MIFIYRNTVFSTQNLAPRLAKDVVQLRLLYTLFLSISLQS